MKLKKIGEFGFIDRVSKSLNQNLNGLIGIGDDCAVIPIDKKKSLLVTTDMLVEDVHFLRNKISAKNLGYKSLAVNLSDIAAMGGYPQSIFISLALPKNIDVEWLDDFYFGLNELAKKNNVVLLGGDTSKSPDKIIINIAVLGYAHPQKIKLRSMAKIGDVICITDCLGDSAGGLQSILSSVSIDKNIKYLIDRHNTPKPFLKEGSFLASQKYVHAMMDVSDGVSSDINRIMEQSNCGADIYLEKIPTSKQLQIVAEKNKWNVDELKLSGGEDYCLLFTVDCAYFDLLSKKYESCFESKIYNIGTIKNVNNGLKIFKNSKIVDIKKGYNHFV